MNFWRLELTVLTDLSASMFAACFMILLIFLSLVQNATHQPPAPFEARETLRIVQRTAEAPTGLVELLHQHDASVGTSIDVFADRVEMVTANGVRRLAPAGIAEALAGIGGPVRLYVFSNVLYNPVAAGLGNLPDRREMTVPEALRDARAPMTAWSPDFLALSAQRLDLPGFRQGLGRLLQGGPDPSGGPAGRPAQAAAGPDLLARVNGWVSVGLATIMPPLGLLVVLSIERRRRRLGWKLDRVRG
jgi:hypothetical protein